MVRWFLAEQRVRIPRDCETTVFCEPRIDSGYPDVVVVVWSPGVTRRWSALRAILNPSTLRVLHYLTGRGACRYEGLRSVFPTSLDRILEHLLYADTIQISGGLIKPRSISHNYAIRQIVAFEAKIGDWRSAVRQAFLNTWFATSSYILVPSPVASRAADVAEAHGVGIICPGTGVIDISKSPRIGSPRSHASWVFNESSWRAALYSGRL